MRVFGVSDIHTDWEENRKRLAALRVGPYAKDVLLVAGDVSHDQGIFSDTMRLLRGRFAQVFFVPGNHDVWIARGDGGDAHLADSLAKHRWLLEECTQLGVWTRPVRFPSERLVVVPLLSWYHAEFDAEPELGQSALPPTSLAARRQQRLAVLGDEMGCAWPEHLGSLPARRNCALAKLFDAANDGHAGAAAIGAALPAEGAAAEAVSFEEALEARRRGECVISFSHFLPRPDLFPEKRFLFFPHLTKAVGSLPLSARVARLQPTIHLFGHTHFAWDAELGASTRFVQAPMGSPREWRLRPRSLRLEGGLPALLWRGRSSAVPVPARRAALWSDYYARHGRQPSSSRLGHWINHAPKKGRLHDESSPQGKRRGSAVLWVVWALDRDPGEEQWAVLRPDEQRRAMACRGGGPRRSFVWMRAALRCILGEQLGVAPRELEFAYGKHGKPTLCAPALAHRCSFNVTHSGDLGAVLLLAQPWGVRECAPPVGVDLERHRERRFEALARRFFLPAELAALRAAAAARSDGAEARLFFDMWTKKEAWLKALSARAYHDRYHAQTSRRSCMRRSTCGF